MNIQQPFNGMRGSPSGWCIAFADDAVSRAAKAEPCELSAEVVMPEQAASAGERKPRGTLSIRTLCMPADTNQNGDIFGGWLLGQMDIAGGIFAHTLAKAAIKML